jgi:hypothetical protein
VQGFGVLDFPPWIEVAGGAAMLAAAATAAAFLRRRWGLSLLRDFMLLFLLTLPLFGAPPLLAAAPFEGPRRDLAIDPCSDKSRHLAEGGAGAVGTIEGAGFRILTLLENRMGEEGRDHVRRNFLMTRKLRDLLVLVHRLWERAR